MGKMKRETLEETRCEDTPPTVSPKKSLSSYCSIPSWKTPVASIEPGYGSWRMATYYLVDSKCCRSQLLQIEILCLLDTDSYKEDRAALEGTGRLVFPADGVAAVVADAEPVA